MLLKKNEAILFIIIRKDTRDTLTGTKLKESTEFPVGDQLRGESQEKGISD